MNFYAHRHKATYYYFQMVNFPCLTFQITEKRVLFEERMSYQERFKKKNVTIALS